MSGSAEDLRDLTYLPLELGITSAELGAMREEIAAAPERHWYESSYRGCSVLPIFTGGGFHRESEMSRHELAFRWTEPAQALRFTRTVMERAVLPWMSPLPRLTVLRTPPGVSISPHIDCSVGDFDRLQHKFRLVLSGKLDSLFFMSGSMEKHPVRPASAAYIIDGSHYHGMDNDSDQTRYTVCAGSPWTGAGSPEYLSLVEREKSRFKREMILRSSIGRPFDRSWFKQERGQTSTPSP